MRVFLGARVMPSGGRVLCLRLVLIYRCSYLHPSFLELAEEGCYFCGYSSLFGVLLQSSCCYGFPKIFATLFFFLQCLITAQNWLLRTRKFFDWSIWLGGARGVKMAPRLFFGAHSILTSWGVAAVEYSLSGQNGTWYDESSLTVCLLFF